jgi:hypothetical protein
MEAEKYLVTISIYVIPTIIGCAGAASPIFSRMFIPDPDRYRNVSDEIDYLLTGQEMLICPIAALINFIRSFMIGRPITGIFIASLSLYIVAYLAALAYYLQLGAQQFKHSTHPYTKGFYKGIPLAAVLISVIFECLKT